MSRKDIDRKEIAAQCLDALGSAYRSNWSNIDGRQTRTELESVASLLRKKVDFTFEEYIARHGIVKTEYGFQWEEDV